MIGTRRSGPNGESFVVRRALVLGAEPELAAAVHASGRAHADAILLGVANARTVLEPVDFKWTLETANPRQVGAEVLGQLLTDAPELLELRLAEALADLPAGEVPILLDGVFMAPDHAENRAHLAPTGPLDPTWAVLVPVDPEEFFSQLPGWDAARALAWADGESLRTLETADRYYRLGAGVLGALRRQRTGLFDAETAAPNGPAELAQLRRERRLTTTGELVAYLDRALIARAELVERLRDVERTSYPFGQFRQDLAARGVPIGGPGADRRWGRLYGEVIRKVGERVSAAGRELIASGKTEAEALAAVALRQADWAAVARRAVDDLLNARVER